jgi:catechol 2,3-dioxygenase-like lactoylglutathione lyase family enzyme
VLELHHTAYVTGDIDSGVRVWQAMFGAKVEMPRTRIAADDVDVCLLEVEGGRIELVQPCDAQRAARQVRDAKGRPNHVCFLCDDLDQRVACAREHGGVVVRPPSRSEAFDKRMCFILYPAVGLVEWVEK